MSEYLLIASTLINLKALFLLKPQINEQSFKQVKTSLLKHLETYQQFKNIVPILREYETKTSLYYTKSFDNFQKFHLQIEQNALFENGNLLDLTNAMQQVEQRNKKFALKKTIIKPFNLSPAQCRLQILQALIKESPISSQKLFKVSSINHFVLTLITLLDMASKQEIILKQETLFGKILVIKNDKGNFNE